MNSRAPLHKSFLNRCPHAECEQGFLAKRCLTCGYVEVEESYFYHLQESISRGTAPFCPLCGWNMLEAAGGEFHCQRCGYAVVYHPDQASVIEFLHADDVDEWFDRVVIEGAAVDCCLCRKNEFRKSGREQAECSHCGFAIRRERPNVFNVFFP